jgi:hypothetical protein
MRLHSIVGIGVSILAIILGIVVALYYVPYPD